MALRAPLAADDALKELDSYLELQESTASSADFEAAESVCERCRAGGTRLGQLLVSAVSNGHRACLSEILQVRERIDLMDARGEKSVTLAHISTRSGNLDVLRMLVKAEQALVNATDERGATPLHVCAYYGHVSCLRCLLQAQARAGDKDLDGATALHFAAASGHLDCLKDLVTIGNADPNERTNGGETPVYFAAQEGHLDCVQWLVEGAGVDPLTASNEGMTPLHGAALMGQLPLIQWLVRVAKCSVTCRSYDGATPVHFAAAKGHTHILEWMLRNSLATGQEQDDFRSTPVHDSAENGQLDCLVVFHTHAVGLSPQDADGKTPRDLAARRGHTQCVAFLDNPDMMYAEMKKQDLQTQDHDNQPEHFKPKRTRSFLKRKPK